MESSVWQLEVLNKLTFIIVIIYPPCRNKTNSIFIARYPQLKENISLTKHYYQSKTSKNMYQTIISTKVTMIMIMAQEIIVKSQINAT